MKKIALTLAMIVGLTGVAQAQGLLLKDYSFGSGDFDSAQLHITLENTQADTVVKAFSGRIECTSLLGETRVANIENHSTRIADVKNFSYEGYYFGVGNSIWGFVKSGKAEDFDCVIITDKEVR